ncbi:MAG TPA: hypothetical protein VMR52_09450 [Dehalococcoidia bacterium]|nr:hypothetical protein [Dehalococcoidia bacterium]
MTHPPNHVACPLCTGTGVCQECRGRGLVACLFCDDAGCEDCDRTGAVVCVPCDSSGGCWRCEGRGFITPPVARKH